MDNQLSPSVVGLLRGMLPDGWDHFEESSYVRCDGINISSQSEPTTVRDRGLRLISANKSIKISSLSPIIGIVKGNKDSEKTSVYYFEVFVISGDCAVGFVPALDNISYHHYTILLNTNSIRSLGNCGNLIHHPDAEFPLLQNNSQQNGETIGCGIIFGTNPTYFFTHNGVRINVEAYGINSRVSSLQTALVPTVALSNSTETFVRTNFGFNADTPFLWNGDENSNLRIISDCGGGSTSAMPPPSSTAVSNLVGVGGGIGMMGVGGNGSNFTPSRNHAYNPGPISTDSGDLLADETYPLPNFTRGTTLSGAIAMQGLQRPTTVPPMMGYAANSPSILGGKLDFPPIAAKPEPEKKPRRRATIETMDHNPDAAKLTAKLGLDRNNRGNSLQNRAYNSGPISNDSGDLLADETYPAPNFTRGTTLSGAIVKQGLQRPNSTAVPPMVEPRRRATIETMDHNRVAAKLTAKLGLDRSSTNNVSPADAMSSNGMMQHGSSSSAIPPPPLKSSQFKEDIGLSSQFKTDDSLSVSRAFPSSDEAEFAKESVFGKSSNVAKMEVESFRRAFPLSDEAEFAKESVFGKSSSVADVEVESFHVENFDLNDVKELATELNRATSASGTNQSSVSQLIAVCKSKLTQLNDKITNSTGEDFGELFSVHDLVTEAISAGESWTRNLESQKRLADMNASSDSLLSTASSNEQTNSEGKGEELRDIFGLLCHLRGRKEQTRVKAVRFLLSITRRESAHGHQQILQSGGLSSLLTLFQSSFESEVLRTMSALNVVNLIPTYTEPLRNIDIIIVIDCLHYLMQSSGLDAGVDFDITPAEVFHACVNAMTFVWVNYIEPKVCWSETNLDGGPNDRNCFEMQRSRPKRRSYLEDEDDVDYCHLLNSFTALAVMSATLDYSDVDGLKKSVPYGFADILQYICAVKACRGLAMKEGVMNVLLKWMRSNDLRMEVIAATALRDLTVPDSSSYTAGWVHAELLHDGNAITDIVERLSAPNWEVRRCMAEIVSCLTGVPHTRAAIIDAQGIKRLGQVLATVERGCADDCVVNVAVGNSLLNLATCSGVYTNCEQSTPRSKPGCIIDDIMKSGAIESLTSMSRLENCKELRFLYSQLIRVVSEASCTAHPLNKLLCDAGAVNVLGEVLSSDVDVMKKFVEATLATANSSDLIEDSLHNDFSAQRKKSGVIHLKDAVNELREVLRGLCNMFSMSAAAEACSQFMSSGAVNSLLWVVSMPPDTFATLDMFRIESRYVYDIRVNSCQALSSLCPVLLSQGTGLKWASPVLSSLIQILKIHADTASTDVFLTVQINALRGIVSLAECEALRTRIVDEFMPHSFNLYQHENEHISDAAMQVCLALGFSAAEMGVRWDAHHLGDKYVFTRALLIQSMVREEIRKSLSEVWAPPLEAIPSHESKDLFSLFENLCSDDDTSDLRDKVRKQFKDIYAATPTSRTRSSGSGHASSTDRTSSSSKRNHQRNRSFIENGDAMLDENISSFKSNPIEDISLHALKAFLDYDDGGVKEPDSNFLGLHQYPLSEFEEERDWIVQHSRALDQVQSETSLLSLSLPARVNDLLDVYFPSELIREEVIPLHGLSPSASFDFHALCMPAGKYTSFRREGQMVSTFLQSERPNCHCSLGFRNSSFALEFADSLLQTLYLCPAIQGLSFSNEPPETSTRRGASCHEFEGSELFANLVRTLPSSISHLTFDDVLSNTAALALVHNIQSMAGDDDDETVGSGMSGSTKGFVCALALMNSPYIKASTFTSLIETIQTPPRDGVDSLFHSLRTLDLSGNNLGDDASARVLEMVLLPSSSHNIECLDLSRNGIKGGHSVKRTLEECQSSKSKLKVLNMSRNGLGVGDVASTIVYSLSDVLSDLTSLDLSSNSLTGEVLDRLGGALPFNSRLENLNVSSNQFQESSVESLISMLDRAVKSSSRLSFLHLNGNHPALTPKQEMMLSHVMIENRKRCISTHFEECLRPRKAAVDESSTGPLSTLSEITFPKFDRGRRNMITVLFSAPLVWKDDRNNYYPIEILDFELEKSLLWQCFTEASRNIVLSYDNATTDRLQAARTKGCGCLHYSGHGHPTHLTFEDGTGGIHWLEVDQLKHLILAGSESGRPPFNFVFVSACHSFLAGQTFVDAGVPHVVCCQQEAQLMDNAALSFTRAFYLALAFGRTVKESFDIGKQAVLNSPTVPNANVEMEKFLLLPEDGNHEVAVLDAEPVPEWPFLHPNGMTTSRRRSSISSSDETETSDYKLPSLAQGFSGRETDMYHVLNLVLSRRLVNITGTSGMGRSSLAIALCHYIDERKSTMMFGQIYFVRSSAKRQVRSSPIFSLCEQIDSTTNKKGSIPTNLDLDETVEIILRALRKTKTLLVFERIELLDGADAQDFKFFLGQILAETKDVHVLISSDKSLGLLQLTGVGEDMYELGPLNFRSTVKLFTFCCPHLQSSHERKELLDLLAPETDIPGDADSRSDVVTEKVKSMLGDGIPARILSAAYQMTVEEFNELKSLRL